MRKKGSGWEMLIPYCSGTGLLLVDPGFSHPPCADVPGVVSARTRVPAFSRLAN